MRYYALSNYPPQIRAKGASKIVIPPHFGKLIGKLIPKRKTAVPGLLGLLLATHALGVQPGGTVSGNSARQETAIPMHDRNSGSPNAYTVLAQAEAPASIFSPWSDQDVRQGTPSWPDVRAVPREFAQPEPAAMPKDVRRSSVPSDDAIPVYRKSNRDDLEDIRLGSRPEHQRSDSGTTATARPSARDSFITLKPFSDADLRQGSRRQPSATAHTGDIPGKPIQVQPEKDIKGFFGRALEKIGF